MWNFKDDSVGVLQAVNTRDCGILNPVATVTLSLHKLYCPTDINPQSSNPQSVITASETELN
jgi:hypothetical protein